MLVNENDDHTSLCHNFFLCYVAATHGVPAVMKREGYASTDTRIDNVGSSMQKAHTEKHDAYPELSRSTRRQFVFPAHAAPTGSHQALCKRGTQVNLVGCNAL